MTYEELIEATCAEIGIEVHPGLREHTVKDKLMLTKKNWGINEITILLTAAFTSAMCAWGANTDWPNLEEVIIATKCHLDVGYTATVPELVRKYSTTDLDNAFALFDSDNDKPADLRARWTVPAWAMDVMLERASPGRRGRLEETIRQHRLMWHAFPFTIETEASDLEELVRMFAFSSGISRRFGFDLPRYVKQTDVPDQAWALPTVLAHAGVKFLHIGINPGCKQKEFLDKLPVLSWWEGPDGSRVLLGFSSGYGWMGWGSLTPPKGWRHKTWLAYMMRSDNKGPISPKDAEKILERAKAEIPGVKVRYGDPAEFADVILAEEKLNPTLPVVRGDMPDTWIHGQMTAPEATRLHRHAKSDLITLGVLDTSLRAFGVKTDPVAGELEQGYRQSCLYSEHTWGFSCYRDRKRFQDPDWRERYDRGEFKHIDDSFDYHMKYARRAYAIAQDGIKKRMEALARSVDVEGPRVVVFNPLPYARDAVVEVEMPEGGRGATALPGALREGNKVRFLAKDVPAGGYKTFPAKNGKCCQCENVASSNVASSQSHQSNQLALKTGIGNIPTLVTLHASHFTVKFDLEKGGIASLVENSTGRELVKQGGHVLGQFLHERFSQNEVLRFVGAYNRAHQRNINSDFGKAGLPPPDKVPYTALTPKNWTAKHVHTALGDEVTLTAGDTLGLAKGYEMRFFFPDHAAYVDISWKVTEKTPDPRPEGGWICLPFNVAAPSFRVGRIGGTIDPAKDIIFGANRNLMCVDRAITVRNGAAGAGVGVASADLPLWSLGKPGLWRYEPDYVPAEPEVFANLYNNQWNTNFPFWIPGSWTASLRVYPVSEGADEETAVFTPAWEIRQPCVAAFAKGSDLATKNAKIAKNGRARTPAAPVAEGVVVSRKGVRVTAFCPNPDGAGTVLRVWEQAGRGGEITVTLPKGLKATSAQPVNLRGEPAGEPIAIKEGTFSFVLGAWAPKSFVLSGGLADVTAVEPYRFYRFAVDMTVGDALQISEVKLFSGNTDVTRSCARAWYEEKTFAPHFKEEYNPLKAVDGDLGTKWYDERAAANRRDAFGKDVWVVLEYAKPVAVTRYEWYTADDTSCYVRRNPVAWRLQGSNDGEHWTELDAVGCAAPHTFDKTLAYSRRLDIPRALPEDAVIYPLATGDGRCLVSYKVNGTTLHELVPVKDNGER